MLTQHGKVELKIEAVAYAPKALTIWVGISEYLCDRGLQTEYVLYSSYPALVNALVAGHIDIAWNTPLVYLQCAPQKIIDQKRSEAKIGGNLRESVRNPSISLG